MKTPSLILTLSFFLPLFVSAQNKIIIPENEKLLVEVDYRLPAFYGATELIFKGKSIISARASSRHNVKPQFAVSISGKAYKFLYLKTVLGTNSIKHLIDVKFTYNNGTNQQTILSDYTANYLYLSVLPELRFTDFSKIVSMFVNGGLSTYTCINNEFYGGGYVGGIYSPKEMASQLNGYALAWETNAGFGVKYNNTGIHFGLGYVHVAAHKEDNSIDFIPALGFTQLRLFVGIIYSLK
jgi:hypothetical protein